MRDPLEQLSVAGGPLDPDAEFADRLRGRIEAIERRADRKLGGPSTDHQTNELGEPMTETSIIPYLAVDDAHAAIDYYAEVFGAEKVEEEFFVDDTGRVGHCSLKIGEAMVYLSDEHPEIGVTGPKSRGGTTVGLIIHVDDADEVMAASVAAGGTMERPVVNQHGHRSGWFFDPWGHRWSPTSPMKPGVD